MAKPAADGPTNAAIEPPSAKVEKFLVRSAASPSEPTRLCTATWKKMWPKPISAGQRNSAASPPPPKGKSNPAAIATPPAAIGRRTPHLLPCRGAQPRRLARRRSRTNQELLHFRARRLDRGVRRAVGRGLC